MRVLLDLRRRALRDDLASVFAGTRTHIDHPVRLANHVLIVFDDDDTIAQVAQVVQGGDQAIVVTLMQTNRGFVQNIHHTR